MDITFHTAYIFFRVGEIDQVKGLENGFHLARATAIEEG